MHRQLFLTISLLVLGPMGWSTTPAQVLDREQVRKLYMEGDFPVLEKVLETYLHGAENETQEDRVFAWKYLSVVYAADASKRAKAEHAIYQLLELAPRIDIVDLYVSKSVDEFFQSVKARFEREKAYARRHDELGNPVDAEFKGKAFPTWAKWALGSVSTTLVVGALVWYLVPEDPDTQVTAITLKP